MKFKLVLQFRGDTLDDYDQLIALEDDLVEQLGDSADVDGHDMGCGELNIFILTRDPVRTFSRVRPVLERSKIMQTVTAAYRRIEGEHYTIIWPKDSTTKFSLT